MGLTSANVAPVHETGAGQTDQAPRSWRSELQCATAGLGYAEASAMLSPNAKGGDQAKGGGAEGTLRAINGHLNPVRRVLGALQSASDANPRLDGLSPRLRQLSTTLNAARYAERLPSVLRAVQAAPRVTQTFNALQANPTRANQRAAAYAIGDFMSNLGHVLELLPNPVGQWATFFTNANGDFFWGIVQQIDANPDRWRRMGLSGAPGSNQTNPGNCRGVQPAGTQCVDGTWQP